MKHNCKIPYFVLAVVWFGLICWASLDSSPPVLGALDGWLAWLPFPKVWQTGVRLVVHFTLYGVWAMLCLQAVRELWPEIRWGRAAAATLAIVMAAGGAIEVVQHWVPNRATDLLDLSGNMVGAGLSLVLARKLRTRDFHHGEHGEEGTREKKP